MDEVMKPKLASWMEIRSERKNYSWNIVRPKARAEARGVGGIGSGEEGHHEADNRHSSTRLVGQFRFQGCVIPLLSAGRAHATLELNLGLTLKLLSFWRSGGASIRLLARAILPKWA